MEKYKDRSQTLDARVEDLLSRMTLKEKVGQLNQRIYGWEAYRRTASGYELTEAFREEIAFGDGVGAVYGLFRADPWSKVTFGNGIELKDSARVANMIQRHVIENTRLGIPVLLSEECPHGHQALDSTLLPVNLGIGSTWNPKLYEEAYSLVAAELRARGCSLGFVSSLDILQDPRWGRSEECYGEDPYLAARMAEAAVKGLQGPGPGEPGAHGEPGGLAGCDRVAAVLKHFCAQGAAAGGHNGKSAVIGERELREIHMPGMKAGTRAGAAACMASYPEIDGMPCHANRWLLTDVLRGEWGFDGVVVSDGCGVDQLLPMTGSYESAIGTALRAGVDLNLWNKSIAGLEGAVFSGRVGESLVDRAVRRVLRLKFMLGLFENPYTDEGLAVSVVGSKKARGKNLELARESIVLLKNEGNILPLAGSIKRIAVIGPNADSIYNQLGDYTPPQRDGAGVTVLEGIRAAAAGRMEIIYAKGCGIRDMSRGGFDEAIRAAEKSDLVVLVLGGSSARDFNIRIAENGAVEVTPGLPSEMDCGEGVDVADLELGGVQVELAKAVAATGRPVAAVLIQGRPHAIPWISENCSAVVCAWYPGQEGGRAVANILFGKANPCGKLPVSIPRSSAQLPVYYNYKSVNDYADMPASPLYPFGYGLSYTTFDYSGLRLSNSEISISDLKKGKYAEIFVDVQNTGATAGAEVVQLYIHDMEASITRRNRELKGFQKVWLEAGEKKTVLLGLGVEELSIWDSEMRFQLEPGNIRIMVGGSSVGTIDIILRITED